ncbi:MAG: nitroreductase family protein [Gammaproteobacteria bacterium]|nr:nitroreductase family protein [Gammaproteobacteria bacterium]
MWDFFTTVRNRHSIRKYQTDMPVEKEKLHAILEMACAAPSAGDLQAYRILVVTDAPTRLKISNIASQQSFINEAPVCLVFCAEPARSAAKFGQRGQDLYALQDATIAAAYAQLAVVAAGLGATWIGYFDEAPLRACLNIGDNLQPVAMLSVGYPAELPSDSPRRVLSDIVDYR